MSRRSPLEVRARFGGAMQAGRWRWARTQGLTEPVGPGRPNGLLERKSNAWVGNWKEIEDLRPKVRKG